MEVLLCGVELGGGLECLSARGTEGKVSRVGAGVVQGLFCGDLVEVPDKQSVCKKRESGCTNVDIISRVDHKHRSTIITHHITIIPRLNIPIARPRSRFEILTRNISIRRTTRIR